MVKYGGIYIENKREKKSMDIKTISSENREQINDFISFHWFSTVIVVRGEFNFYNIMLYSGIIVLCCKKQMGRRNI